MMRWTRTGLMLFVVAGLVVLQTGSARADDDDKVSVSAAFGRGLNTNQAGNLVNHVILPNDIKVREDGVVKATTTTTRNSAPVSSVGCGPISPFCSCGERRNDSHEGGKASNWPTVAAKRSNEVENPIGDISGDGGSLISAKSVTARAPRPGMPPVTSDAADQPHPPKKTRAS